MNNFKGYLKDQMDLVMTNYINSEQYSNEQKAIIEMEKSFLSFLNDEQKKSYFMLEEAINLSNSNFSYEAFYQGLINSNNYSEVKI